MPAGLLAAGAEIAGGVINSVGTAVQNKKNRQFTERMYDRQKNDNIEFWNMQNSYNSPASQMSRFKDAGLNPNLVYGQGSSGNASPVSTPDVQPLNNRNPEFGNAISGGLTKLLGIADLKIKQAQYNNLVAQNDAIKQETVLRGIQARRGEFDLGFETELRSTSADARRERVRQMQASTNYTLEENVRRAIMNATSVQEAAERMITMQAQRNVIPYQKAQMTASTAESYERIRNMQKDGTLKDLEIGLRRNNVTFADPLWQRIVAGVLDGTTTVPEALKSIDEAGMKAGSYIRDWFRHPFPR